MLLPASSVTSFFTVIMSPITSRHFWWPLCTVKLVSLNGSFSIFNSPQVSIYLSNLPEAIKGEFSPLPMRFSYTLYGRGTYVSLTRNFITSSRFKTSIKFTYNIFWQIKMEVQCDFVTRFCYPDDSSKYVCRVMGIKITKPSTRKMKFNGIHSQERSQRSNKDVEAIWFHEGVIEYFPRCVPT